MKLIDFYQIELKKEREINAFKFKLIKFIKIYNTRSSILFVREQEPIPEFKQILQLAKELVVKTILNCILYICQNIIVILKPTIIKITIQ